MNPPVAGRKIASSSRNLVEYGDARALDVLAQTFDVLPLREGDNPLANHVFIELRCAIEALGGHLTEAQLHKFEQADAPRRRFVAQMYRDVGVVRACT